MKLEVSGPIGAEDTRRLAAAAPQSAIVVFTMTADEDDVVGPLAAGACGCVVKDAPLQDIASAIRAAACGESVVSPPVVTTLVRRLRREGAGELRGRPELTPRELEVLRLLARGWDNARIAAALYLARGTVKHHISSILLKLKVENRIQAAVRAVEEGLLET